MSKTLFIVALSCIVMVPMGAFAGHKIYSLFQGAPPSALEWWQQNWLIMLVSGILAAVIVSIVAWRMQKLGV